MGITEIRARIHSAHIAISVAELRIDACRSAKAPDTVLHEALAALAAAQHELREAVQARSLFQTRSDLTKPA